MRIKYGKKINQWACYNRIWSWSPIKGESDNEGPWLNWDWLWILIIEMVKKIWAAVIEFSQETENFHPCPMLCGKHGPRASLTTKTSAFGLGFCLLSPSGHVFHMARETMIKSYNTSVMHTLEHYVRTLCYVRTLHLWVPTAIACPYSGTSDTIFLSWIRTTIHHCYISSGATISFW